MSKSSLTIQEVNHAVMFGSFTDDQLNSVWAAVKYAKAQKARANIWTFRVGDDVRFNGKGRAVVGKVTKLGRKYVQVKEGYTTWRVPANMLEAA